MTEYSTNTNNEFWDTLRHALSIVIIIGVITKEIKINIILNASTHKIDATPSIISMH